MRSIAIFGGSGFVSQHLIDLLNKTYKNLKIYILDIKKPSPILLIKHSNIFYIKCDVRNKIFIDLVNIDLIINLAAIHREPGHDYYEYFDTNIRGAENICTFAMQVNCLNIIFTSSISVYGGTNTIKNEETVPCPSTAYGSSKLVAEKILIGWYNRDLKNHTLAILRPGVVFGKDENGNMSRLVKLIYKKLFFYMGNKDTCKAGIYVKELANQILWAHKKQLKNTLPKLVLFNSTMWPNPSISDYVSSVQKVSGLNRFIPNVPYLFLMFFGFVFNLLFLFIGKPNPFSTVRIRKLVSPNLIKPSFLIHHKYNSSFSLDSALMDWKKEDPEVWT